MALAARPRLRQAGGMEPQVGTEVIRAAVQLACRSPSLHNSQPWRWMAVEGDIPTVELHLDPERVLHATDHSGRQALMSCGAALDHFRVAIAAAGWTAHVERFPNPNDRHHLASMTFTPLAPVTEGHHLRADAILKRRTDRSANPPTGISSSSSCAARSATRPSGSTSSTTGCAANWPRRRGSANRCDSTTPRTTPNYLGGQENSSHRRASRTAHWSRRRKANGW